MSTIDTAIEKIKSLKSQFIVVGEAETILDEVISLLTDKKVLFIEWNALDFQAAARQKIARMANVEENEIIENPLSQEDLEMVVKLLNSHYDANVGVTWDTINCILDDIALPDVELARKRVKVVLEVRSDYLMNIIAPIVKQMSAAGREADALKMIQEINSVGRYFDALEIVAKYVDIEYNETK